MFFPLHVHICAAYSENFVLIIFVKEISNFVNECALLCGLVNIENKVVCRRILVLVAENCKS